MKIPILLLLFCSLTTFAEQTNNNTTIDTDESLITVGQLHFSVAMGIGEKTNPLVGGKNIPLYLVPSFQYYRDNFYFDNGDLGYTFFENDQFVVSALTRVNSENSYFSRWHPQNVFLSSAADAAQGIISPDNPAAPTEKIDIDIDIENISKRKWALDAGMQVNWFASDNLSFLGQLMHDVNSIYDGYNGNFKMLYRYKPKTIENLSIQTTLGFDWSSSAMVDYYYGLDEKDYLDYELNEKDKRDHKIDEKEKLVGDNFYQGHSSISPYFKFYAGYHLSKNWKAFFSVNYKHLGSGIKDSPIVDKDYTLTSFIGVSYVFTR